MTDYLIDRSSLAAAEVANSLRLWANAADGYHAHEIGGTYGAAKDAVIKALACGMAECSTAYYWDAVASARLILEACVDNGESVTYQIDHVFCPGNPYETPFTVTVVDGDLTIPALTVEVVPTREGGR